jgi:hypothetical protein
MMQIWFQSRLVNFDHRKELANRLPPRLQVVRSADVIAALRSYEVDLALVHQYEGDEWADRIHSTVVGSTSRVPATLAYRTLATWTAVGVGPEGAPAGPVEGWRTVWWSPASAASRITALARRSSRINDFLGGVDSDYSKNRHVRDPGSWLSAFEEARQGVPVRFVIPDVLVPTKDRKQLTIVKPETTEVECQGHILAIYRAADEEREELEPIWDAFPGAKLQAHEPQKDD